LLVFLLDAIQLHRTGKSTLAFQVSRQENETTK